MSDSEDERLPVITLRRIDKEKQKQEEKLKQLAKETLMQEP
jgi:hypothetical protein